MGVLDNPKWELFAREAAKGAKGATAYKAAGYTATDKAAASNAYKLLQRADIKARVAELMNERDEQRAEASEKAMEKLAIDREWGSRKNDRAGVSGLRNGSTRLSYPRA